MVNIFLFVSLFVVQKLFCRLPYQNLVLYGILNSHSAFMQNLIKSKED